MLSWMRAEKIESQVPELVVRSPDGETWAAFPWTVVDQMRRLISRMGRKEAAPSRLSFVAALRQEGVTYVSWAYATTLAYDVETSVCLVDLNWWWPSDMFSKVPDCGGLAAVLTKQTTLSEATVNSGIPNLAILPAGDLSLHERALFSRSTVLKETIMELAASYDHLVLDIPSVLASPDAIPLASLGDACCFVIHQGVTSLTDVKTALSDLDHLPQLGAVMNKFHLDTPRLIQRFVDPYSP
jgi:Mrp family chromosome partitioning ATPase